MNHKQTIKFHNKKITIGDMLKKKNKDILIGLYRITEKLDDSTTRVYERINGINENLNNHSKRKRKK